MNNIKSLRKEKGWSAQLLADKLNIAQTTLSQYENSKREANYETLHKLSKIFNVSIDYLLGFENEKKYLLNTQEAKELWLESLDILQRQLVNEVLQLNELHQYKTLFYMHELNKE